EEEELGVFHQFSHIWDSNNFKDKCEPLLEMVKGVMLRARDALPAPYDITQTWVDG
ncbi:unnamed protein product, partial [Musa hybrid cultivar]